MTPSGRWQPRVRQPAATDGLNGRSVDMDAKGRALLAWWDGTDLMVRWSRPGGGWRGSCVLAVGVTKPRSQYRRDAQIAVNRRGDALVVWADKGRVPQLWARYKPSGQGWTKPVKVTRGEQSAGVLHRRARRRRTCGDHMDVTQRARTPYRADLARALRSADGQLSPRATQKTGSAYRNQDLRAPNGASPRRESDTLQRTLMPRVDRNTSSWLSPEMTSINSSSTPAMPDDTILRLAIAAHLARYKGQSRDHVYSDLRSFVRWCQLRHLAPLAATRPQVELYVRWMQEVQRYKPSTVSRRLSVIVGFYRTCVIDHILEHSPADYVRRPHVPAESPTLGLSHLQFEAMLSTARDSMNLYDFAVVTMLGLLGLRICEATGSSIEDLSDSHGHRVLRVHGKGDKVVLTPLAPAVARAIDRAAADRSGGPIPVEPHGQPYGQARRHPSSSRACRTGWRSAARYAPAHAASHLCHHDARCRSAATRRPDRRSPRRPANTIRYDRARRNLDRHPNYILAAYMASGT